MSSVAVNCEGVSAGARRESACEYLDSWIVWIVLFICVRPAGCVTQHCPALHGRSLSPVFTTMPGPGAAEDRAVQPQTKVREDFTITEKATRASWLQLLTLSLLRR